MTDKNLALSNFQNIAEITRNKSDRAKIEALQREIDALREKLTQAHQILKEVRQDYLNEKNLYPDEFYFSNRDELLPRINDIFIKIEE